MKLDQLDMQVAMNTSQLRAHFHELHLQVAVWEPRPMPDNWEREE